MADSAEWRGWTEPQRTNLVLTCMSRLGRADHRRGSHPCMPRGQSCLVSFVDWPAWPAVLSNRTAACLRGRGISASLSRVSDGLGFIRRSCKWQNTSNSWYARAKHCLPSFASAEVVCPGSTGGLHCTAPHRTVLGCLRLLLVVRACG